MQWNQPVPADRPRVLAFAGTGAVFGYLLAIGLISALFRGAPWYSAEAPASVFSRVSVGAMAVLVLGLATLCADIFWEVRRRPSSRTTRVLRSEDGTLLVALLAIALGMLAFASGGADALLRDGADSPILGRAIVGALGALGLLCLAGAIQVGWNAMTRGPSTLALEGTHVAAGLPLNAVLEIPFAASRAPVTTISVELTRWEAPTSSEDASSASVVWSECMKVKDWAPRGPRRASTRVTYQIPEGPPADVHDPRVTYVWSLTARPEDNVAWNAQFTLPIRFVEDEVVAA